MDDLKITKVIGIAALALTLSACAGSKDESKGAQDPQVALRSVSEMPTLHKIQSYVFKKPYSDNGNYDLSAMFLSDFADVRNAPDLLFNGKCGGKLYLEASTAGDDFAVISDLGNVPLKNVTAHKAFNYEEVVGQNTNFQTDALVIAGHTYAVLLAKADVRGLFIVRVESVSRDCQMQIRYVVKNYEIKDTIRESGGFDWEKENQ